MARKTFPRKDTFHAVTASHVLARYEQQTGRPITLPVPIDLIIETTYGITIDWDEIDEPAGRMILGALSPKNKTIVMNTRHVAMFERWVGPERFTKAHELAHWIYDAENPDQGLLDFEAPLEDTFCYYRDADGLDETTRIREMNANKLAAHLMLPDHLVRQADMDEVLADFRRTARRWGVSGITLRIKLENLGLLDDTDIERLGLPLD